MIEKTKKQKTAVGGLFYVYPAIKKKEDKGANKKTTDKHHNHKRETKKQKQTH